MRTGVPLVVASSLFGASTQTRTAAFTTWVCFLRKELQPFVRMPDLHEVREYAPKSFTLAGLENGIVVLDATELEIVRVWQTDLAYVLYSTYKRRPTGKYLLGLTPAGAICFISNMYGCRLSDTEVVVRSGFIDLLAAKGFGPGVEVMADRGFNPIARHLLRVGIKMTVPPSARKGEERFTGIDADESRTVAKLRIHVERAIGSLKQWRLLNTKFTSKNMDLIPSVVDVCASLVNILNSPF
ncbi:unnamed protein product [Pylaiella littoralis]